MVTKVDYPVPQTGMQKYGKGLLTSIKTIIPVYGSYSIGKIDLAHDNLKDDVVELSKGKNAKCEKEKTGESIAHGILYKVKTCVPFLSAYTFGQDKIEHENLKQDVANLKEGKTVSEHKKAGVFKTIGRGILEKIKLCLPVYGTYYAGKSIAETEAMKADVQAIQDEKDGVAVNN